jgi:hypothetical protein
MMLLTVRLRKLALQSALAVIERDSRFYLPFAPP